MGLLNRKSILVIVTLGFGGVVTGVAQQLHFGRSGSFITSMIRTSAGFAAIS